MNFLGEHFLREDVRPGTCVGLERARLPQQVHLHKARNGVRYLIYGSRAANGISHMINVWRRLNRAENCASNTSALPVDVFAR